MSSLLIRNIKQLVGIDPPQAPLRGSTLQQLHSLHQAWLLIEGERIADFGPMASCPDRADQQIDASGRMLFPSWCDSHSHLVFAASREGEFVDRIKGLSYAEIAAKGGGILNSARRLQATSEEDLLEAAYARLLEVQAGGTGALEIKSGYGLTLDSELKMLRVIRRLRERSSLSIKATFLGAHALPKAFADRREDYLRLIIEEMLPRIADEGLADYIDVFCEKGFFSVPEAEAIMEAGQRYGLKAKIHTNQFTMMGGIQAAVAHQAISVDHLEVVNDEEMECLRTSSTLPTLLPSAPFFLNDHYPPARKMIDAGLPVVLASDYNPGTTPSGYMPFVLSLACIKLRMTPEEAINAATINGACAMELQDQLGSISKGKIANLFLTQKIPSIAYLPYAFGSRLVDQIILRGQLSHSA
ncbi:MAG: imidazolonepropionase [Bacteroidota bacterium]